MMTVDARKELENSKKALAEFLNGRCAWSGEIIPIDMNMYNSRRGRTEPETVIHATLMTTLNVTGEDVNRICDQWEAFAKSKKYKNAWWDLFDAKLGNKILSDRQKQKESSAAIMSKLDADRKKRQERATSRPAGIAVSRPGSSAAAVDTDFADDDLI